MAAMYVEIQALYRVLGMFWYVCRKLKQGGDQWCYFGDTRIVRFFDIGRVSPVWRVNELLYLGDSGYATLLYLVWAHANFNSDWDWDWDLVPSPLPLSPAFFRHYK